MYRKIRKFDFNCSMPQQFDIILIRDIDYLWALLCTCRDIKKKHTQYPFFLMMRKHQKPTFLLSYSQFHLYIKGYIDFVLNSMLLLCHKKEDSVCSTVPVDIFIFKHFKIIFLFCCYLWWFQSYAPWKRDHTHAILKCFPFDFISLCTQYLLKSQINDHFDLKFFLSQFRKLMASQAT